LGTSEKIVNYCMTFRSQPALMSSSCLQQLARKSLLTFAKKFSLILMELLWRSLVFETRDWWILDGNWGAWEL